MRTPTGKTPTATESALTALVKREAEAPRKASNGGASQTSINVPKAQTIYLRTAEQQSLREWRIGLAGLDPEGQQPSTSEIVRVALRLLPKDMAAIYAEMQRLRDEDGRK